MSCVYRTGHANLRAGKTLSSWVPGRVNGAPTRVIVGRLERPVKSAEITKYNINLRRLLAVENAARESGPQEGNRQ